MKYSIQCRLIKDEIIDEHEYSQSHFTWGEGSWETYYKRTNRYALVEHFLFVDNVDLYNKLGGKTDDIELESKSEPSTYPMPFRDISGIHDMQICGISKDVDGDYIYVSQEIIDKKELFSYERLLRLSSSSGLFLVRTVKRAHHYTLDKQTYSTR
jgi:hypothetical protein